MNGSIQTRAAEILLPRRSPPEYLISSNIRTFPPPNGDIMCCGTENIRLFSIVQQKANVCMSSGLRSFKLIVRVAYAVIGAVAEYLHGLGIQPHLCSRDDIEAAACLRSYL